MYVIYFILSVLMGNMEYTVNKLSVINTNISPTKQTLDNKMNYLSTINATSDTKIENGVFSKSYDIPEEHWTRIKKVSQYLSDASIGPLVISINEDDKEIFYEEVSPLDCTLVDDPEMIKTLYGLTTSEIINKITELVDRLHQQGYGHGDLHMNNIGFKDGRFYILDHDTVYRIDEGMVPWLKKWIDEGFDGCFDGESFDDFVADDYEGWRSDWLN